MSANKYLNDDDDEISIESDEEVNVHDLVQSGDEETIKYYGTVNRMRLLYEKDDYGRVPFYYIAELGRDNLIGYFIRLGADVNARDADERTALHGAAFMGLVETCKILLNFGAKIDLKDIMSRTPLLEAVSMNKIEAAVLLIELGANLEAKEVKDGRTALHLAAERGFSPMVDTLVIHGADMHSEKFKNDSIYSLTPLHLAVINNHIDTVKVLLDRGADTSELCGFRDKAPLHISCEKGYIEVTELLLKYGANIQIMGQVGVNGATPLHLAAQYGHIDLVKILVSKGALIDALGKYTCVGTSLHVACEHGHLDIVKYLLDVGYNNFVNIKEVTGLTPLHQALACKQYDVAFYLIEKNADLTLKCIRGKTPMDNVPSSGIKEKLREAGIAAEIERARLRAIEEAINKENERKKMLELEKKRQAELEKIRQLEITENFRQLMLTTTDLNGELGAFADIAQQFSNQDINMIVKIDERMTSLICACRRGFEPIVISLLMWPNIDVNIQDIYGNTALHYAAKEGYKSICERLVLAGARHGILNNDGFAAATIARYGPIAELLRDPSILENMNRKVETTNTIASITAMNNIIDNHTSGQLSIQNAVNTVMNGRRGSSFNMGRGGSNSTTASFSAVNRMRKSISAGFDNATMINSNFGNGINIVELGVASEGFVKGAFDKVPLTFGGCRRDMFNIGVLSSGNNDSDKIDSTKVIDKEITNDGVTNSVTKDQYKEWQILEIKKITAVYLPNHNEEEDINKRMKQLQIKLITQNDQPPTLFEATIDWIEVKDFLFLLGHPYRDIDINMRDKRKLLYLIAKCMDVAHIIFTTPHQSNTNDRPIQDELAYVCSLYVQFVCFLFEPAEGWGIDTTIDANCTNAEISLVYTYLDMQYIISLIMQSKLITGDIEDSLMKILDSSQQSIYNNQESCPYRFRRIIIDEMYEVSALLKIRAEASFPVDAIRSHVWAKEGRNKINEILHSKTKIRSKLSDGISPSIDVQNLKVKDADMLSCGVGLWLLDNELDEYFLNFLYAGFKLIDDFKGLSSEDCMEYFPFLKPGDRLRLAKLILQINNSLIDNYSRRASNFEEKYQIPPVPVVKMK